jgi:hypothetical protein
MHEINKALREGEKEGRLDTRNAMNSLRENGQIPFEYIKKITRRTMSTAFITGAVSFFYFLSHHASLLLSALYGIGIFYLLAIAFPLALFGTMKFIAKRSKKRKPSLSEIMDAVAQGMTNNLKRKTSEEQAD